MNTKSKSIAEIIIQYLLLALAAGIGSYAGIRPGVLVIISVCALGAGFIEGYDKGIVAAMKYFKRQGDRKGGP